jgi:hypothetical protein
MIIFQVICLTTRIAKWVQQAIGKSSQIVFELTITDQLDFSAAG